MDTLSDSPTPATVPGLSLRGPIDATCAGHLRVQVQALEAAHWTRAVCCAGVSAIDPVGIHLLWQLCAESDARGVRLRLDDFPLRFLHRLRLHPITDFIGGDDVFQDPFGTTLPSER
jgi:ABC-type transporter Mla MlaB component